MAEKTITVNRKAQYDYHILRTLEAGLSLLGTEIKSIREGKVSIREAYVRPDDERDVAGGRARGAVRAGGFGEPRPDAAAAAPAAPAADRGARGAPLSPRA